MFRHGFAFAAMLAVAALASAPALASPRPYDYGPAASAPTDNMTTNTFIAGHRTNVVRFVAALRLGRASLRRAVHIYPIQNISGGADRFGRLQIAFDAPRPIQPG